MNIKKKIVFLVLLAVCLGRIAAIEPVQRRSGSSMRFPFIDQLTVYDGEGHEFRLWMTADEVVAQLGEPDTIEYYNTFPENKDKYNPVKISYNSGITFSYRKGFPQIFDITLTRSAYYVSLDKLSPGECTVEDILACYGRMTYMTSVRKRAEGDVFHVAYATQNEKLIGSEPFKNEYTFAIHFYCDYDSKKCFQIGLFADSGV
ncbi:hypothetical protein K7I13_10055 [Brucepastera parasyntrophica]|uniref:hypothetical protein n=1 Tax=Brucepastera parasyntrophica TaxID=2880008 RepID=UPI00210B4EA8|nr:hypothetical protein [Brucepastera parasyntrophica]ULQ58871.1 hypothetical protein K7I13_10055 [Brucepastera parasyntrophica]